MTKPCMKTCAISVIAVFAFLMGYDMFVHGTLLKADYEATASMWRTPEEMKALFPLCLAYHFFLAMVLTCLFKKFRAGCCAKNPEAATACCPIKSGGICFGLKIGILMGLLHASGYIWLPIPAALAIKWFVASLIQGVGVGVVLGMLCKGKGSCGTTSCSTNTCDSGK
jgi:hypothetical protein